MRRGSWTPLLGLLIAVVVTQSASAACAVRPIDRLVNSSDDVWWGTVTGATSSPGGAGIWKLTVRLDDVLKGEGGAGDSFAVFTSACGKYIAPQDAEQDAQSFIGQQRLFLIGEDHQNRFVAYSEIVKVPDAPYGGGSAQDQYAAALAALHLRRNTQPAGTSLVVESLTPILRLAAAMSVVAIAIAVVLLRTTRRRSSSH